jgi:hypothetical protein
MPTARSRLADIEGPGLGKPLTRDALDHAKAKLLACFGRFLTAVEATEQESKDGLLEIADVITNTTARQLREIEERDDE